MPNECRKREKQWRKKHKNINLYFIHEVKYKSTFKKHHYKCCRENETKKKRIEIKEKKGHHFPSGKRMNLINLCENRKSFLIRVTFGYLYVWLVIWPSLAVMRLE